MILIWFECILPTVELDRLLCLLIMRLYEKWIRWGSSAECNARWRRSYLSHCSWWSSGRFDHSVKVYLLRRCLWWARELLWGFMLLRWASWILNCNDLTLCLSCGLFRMLVLQVRNLLRSPKWAESIFSISDRGEKMLFALSSLHTSYESLICFFFLLDLPCDCFT